MLLIMKTLNIFPFWYLSLCQHQDLQWSLLSHINFCNEEEFSVLYLPPPACLLEGLMLPLPPPCPEYLMSALHAHHKNSAPSLLQECRVMNNSLGVGNELHFCKEKKKIWLIKRITFNRQLICFSWHTMVVSEQILCKHIYIYFTTLSFFLLSFQCDATCYKKPFFFNSTWKSKMIAFFHRELQQSGNLNGCRCPLAYFRWPDLSKVGI